jgi:hypothetical protein
MKNNKKLILKIKKNTLKESNNFGGGTTKYIDALTVIKLMLSEKAPDNQATAKVMGRLDQIINFASQINNIQLPDLSSQEDIMAMQNKISNKIVQQRIQDELLKIGLEPELVNSFLDYIKETGPAPEIKKTEQKPAIDQAMATNPTQISSPPNSKPTVITRRIPNLAKTEP